MLNIQWEMMTPPLNGNFLKAMHAGFITLQMTYK